MCFGKRLTKKGVLGVLFIVLSTLVALFVTLFMNGNPLTTSWTYPVLAGFVSMGGYALMEDIVKV